jgi:hypothetical protein
MVHSHITNILILASLLAALAITSPRGFCGEELAKDPSADFHEVLDYYLSHTYRAQIFQSHNKKIEAYICGVLMTDRGVFSKVTKVNSQSCISFEF